MSAALGRLAARHYATCALLVMLGTAGNVFVELGRTRIDDSDEARYGVSAYEMLQHRSFLVTTYAGRPEYWNLKPPLGYWILATSFWVFGPTPLALRLPSAVFALGTVALLMAFCRRHLGRPEALLAGAIVATCFGLLSHHGARSGDLDSALTFLVVLAATLVPDLAGSAPRWLALWSIFAAAFLLKSFAIAPMMLVVALHLAVTGDWRRVHRATCMAGALLFGTVVALWGVARWQAEGTTRFLQRIFTDELVRRCVKQVDHGVSSRTDYLSGLFDRFAPWPLLLLVAVALAARAGGWRRVWTTLGPGERPVGLLLALWAAVPLVVFSLAKTHHHWYLDPSYPVMAAITACALAWMVRRAPPARRTLILLLLVALPLVLCEARVLGRILSRDRMPESQLALLALRERRAELGPELRAIGRLSHSERFILEAVDGYRIVDDRPPRRHRFRVTTSAPPGGPRAAGVN